MHPRIYLLYKQADVSFNERKAANGKVLVSTVEEVINAVLIACKLLEDVKINNLVIKIINEAVMNAIITNKAKKGVSMSCETFFSLIEDLLF